MHDGPHSSTQHHSVPRSLLGTAHPPYDLSKPRGGGQNMPGPRGRAVCSSGTQRRRAEASTGACRFNPSNYKAAYKYLLGASLPLLFDVVLLFTSNPLLLLLFLSSLLSPPFHGCLRAALQKQLRKEAGKSLGARDSQTPARSLPPAKPRMRALPRLCSLQHPSGAELRRSELKPCTHGWLSPACRACCGLTSQQPHPAFAHQPWFMPSLVLLRHSLTFPIQTRSGNAGRIRGGQTQEMQLGASSPLDRVVSSNYTTRIAEGLQGPLGTRAHLEKDLSSLR